MKKFLIIFLLFFFVMFIAVASSSAQASNMAQSKYYRSLYNCQKGTYTPDSIEMFGRTINFEYRVLGIQNNKCYIREKMGGVIINCALPISVAQRYAQEGVQVIQQSQQGVGYSEYMNQIQNDSRYCKINAGG